MLDAVDRAIATGLRALPDVRGKARLALRWKTRRERQLPLEGDWELHLADGSSLRAPLGSSMTWTAAVMGHWDRPVIELVGRYVAPSSLVLDIGASLGFWTVPLGKLAASCGALLWSFEPNPINVRWLEINVERNGLADAVEIHPFALGSRSGEARLWGCEHGGGNGVLDAGASADAMSVRVAALDDLALSRRVSFIKLDVEGFEVEVLRGARGTIERDRPVILGEFNHEWLRARGESLPAAVRELTAIGYEAFSLEAERSALWHARDRTSLRRLPDPVPDGAQNLLLVPAQA